MKHKRKIIYIIFLLLICIKSYDSVFAEETWEERKLSSYKIVNNEQTFNIDKFFDGYETYFEYSPSEDGVYDFKTECKNGEEVLQYDKQFDEAIFSKEGSVMHVNFTMEEKKIAIKANEKIYIRLSFHSKFLDDCKVKFTIKKTMSDVKVTLYNNKTGETKDVREYNIDGLSWDALTGELTINNYIADKYVEIRCRREDVSSNLYVNVIGKNIFKDCVHVFNFGNLAEYKRVNWVKIVGNGEININNTEVEEDASIFAERLIIDGTQIYYAGSRRHVGSSKGSIIGALEMSIHSGVLCFDLLPIIYENTFKEMEINYGCLSAGSFFMNGGTIIFKAHRPALPLSNYYCYGIRDKGGAIFSHYIELNGGIIVITGDDREFMDMVYGGSKGISYSDYYTCSGDFKVIYSEIIDINKLKAYIVDEMIIYDGKEKKPDVYIDGLKIGEDYDVEYKNNIDVGCGEIIITGKGYFTGKKILYFDIVQPKKNGVNKSNNKKNTKNILQYYVGKKISDKKYAYRITKVGSKDGSVIGELEVTGLKRKSLTVIKIAKQVTIDGTTYNVTSIAKNAFRGNKRIKKVYIGKNLKTIGASAFSNCKKVKTVIINSTILEVIGKKAFYNNISLKKVIIKSIKLNKISKKAFYRKNGKKIVFFIFGKKKTIYKKYLKNAKTNRYTIIQK